MRISQSSRQKSCEDASHTVPSPPAGAGLSHLGEHTEQEGLVPARAFDFAADGSFVGMCAKHIERELAQNGQVFRSVVFAIARAILVEDDIEDPVQLVLDAPMAAGDGENASGREGLR